MAEPGESRGIFPLIGQIVPIPARWWNFARWVEFLAVLILWFGLMLLLYVALRGTGSEITKSLLSIMCGVGGIPLTRAYFPEQRGVIEEQDQVSLTEPSFLGFIFPVPDKWQALVLRVEVGLVSTLFVVGAALLLKLLLSMEEGVLGLILWLIICGVIGKALMDMYLPGLREWRLGSHERES